MGVTSLANVVGPAESVAVLSDVSAANERVESKRKAQNAIITVPCVRNAECLDRIMFAPFSYFTAKNDVDPTQAGVYPIRSL
jgi:hypothetical protein